MKAWIIVLKVFGYIWVTLGVITMLVGILGTGMKGGASEVQELMSHFNLVNWIVMVITLTPGLGALVWAKNLSEKQANVRARPSNP